MSEKHYTEIVWSVPDALIWHDGEPEPRREQFSHAVRVHGIGREACEKGNALLAEWFRTRLARDEDVWPSCGFRVKELPMDNVRTTYTERIILPNLGGSR